MPVYEYVGKDTAGRSVKGSLDVDGVRALKSALRRQNIFLTEYREANARGAQKGAKIKAGVQQKSGSRDVEVGEMFTRITPQEISETTRQLATLLKATVPLVEALAATVEQVENPKLKRVLAQVRTDVNEGAPFWRALAVHDKIFESTYYNMIRAGESSGNLDAVMMRLADFTESQVKLRNKIVGAMTYPVIMLIISLLIVMGMMLFVVPSITAMFKDLGADLPFITKLLIGMSEGLANFWWLGVLILVGAWQAFKRWKNSESGAESWDRSLLKVPVLGDLLRKIAIARFSRTLGTLLQAGVPLLTAMEIVENVVANRVLTKVLTEARNAIREGDSIAGPLKRSGQFPSMVVHMIAIGERSGELENMLTNVSESYENQVDTRVAALTSLLEPLMIVFMGIVVGFLVAAILLPMMKLTQAVQQG